MPKKKVSFGGAKKKAGKIHKININTLTGLKKAENLKARGYSIIKSDFTYVWMSKR